MGKKAKPCECEECLPAWLAAFGDLMSLLLCFFVLLLSMATMDPQKVTEALGSLSGAMSVLDGGVDAQTSIAKNESENPNEMTSKSTTDSPQEVTAAVKELNEMQQSAQGTEATLEESEDGFVIKLPSQLLFKAGSAKIESEDSILFLKRIALIVQSLPNEVDLSVRGFTDNQPPDKDSTFKDNWELSSARAIAVLNELILDGVDPKKVSAAAYGEHHPIASNMTPEGRAKNRRVELHFQTAKKSKKDDLKKQSSVLEQGMPPQ
jgi:chemotaxis protein MotB